MNHREYSHIMERYGLNHIQIAAILGGITARTSYRWASGESEIPRLSGAMIWWLVSTGAGPEKWAELLLATERRGEEFLQHAKRKSELSVA